MDNVMLVPVRPEPSVAKSCTTFCRAANTFAW